MIGIEDSVRLSASAVLASLALSHTYGDYNRRMLVNEMVIARGLKTVLQVIIINDYQIITLSVRRLRRWATLSHIQHNLAAYYGLYLALSNERIHNVAITIIGY